MADPDPASLATTWTKESDAPRTRYRRRVDGAPRAGGEPRRGLGSRQSKDETSDGFVSRHGRETRATQRAIQGAGCFNGHSLPPPRWCTSRIDQKAQPTSVPDVRPDIQNAPRPAWESGWSLPVGTKRSVPGRASSPHPYAVMKISYTGDPDNLSLNTLSLELPRNGARVVGDYLGNLGEGQP